MKMPKYVNCLNARMCAAVHGSFHLFGPLYNDWLTLEAPQFMKKEQGHFLECYIITSDEECACKRLVQMLINPWGSFKKTRSQERGRGFHFQIV